jgi:hypothetical protein
MDQFKKPANQPEPSNKPQNQEEEKHQVGHELANRKPGQNETPLKKQQDKQGSAKDSDA